MEVWLHAFSFPGKVAELARKAEAWGFTGLLLADSQNLNADIWVELALAGAATSRLRLGPGVTNSVTRHLAVTASAACTLQAETGGRATLGFGRGDSALAQIGLLFYVLIYTGYLKRSTPQNIVIGGAAGAVPVLVGWAAVTNSITLSAIWLFAIIFYWTPPHFWALSLLIQKDYEKAHIPMMPVVMGEYETRRQILLYSLLLLAVTLVLFAMGAMGYFYLAGAVILSSGMIYLAIRLLHDQSKKWARTLFWYSNMYLAAIFAVMVLDRVIH